MIIRYSVIRCRSFINYFEGFHVCRAAQNGKKAIQLLEQNSNLPDIILLDIVMPGISGIEVTKWIFDNKKTIKILALTMEEDDNSVLQMLKYSVTGYYFMPFITGNMIKSLKENIALNAPQLSKEEKDT